MTEKKYYWWNLILDENPSMVALDYDGIEKAIEQRMELERLRNQLNPPPDNLDARHFADEIYVVVQKDYPIPSWVLDFAEKYHEWRNSINKPLL